MGILDVNAGLSGSMTQSLNTISNVNRLANDSIARINSGLKFTHASDNPAAIIKAQEMQSDMSANNGAIEDNNYTLGQFDTILSAQDQVVSSLQEMKSLKEQYDAESDADAQAILAEKYKAYGANIATMVDGATFKGMKVLQGGATENINSFATSGSVSLSFSDLSLDGLSLGSDDDPSNLTAIGTITTGALDTALNTVMKNNALLSTSQDIFEKANDVMAASNTAWAQSYNELVQVNDAEESALLTSLSNRASAASAAMSYQSQFYNITSGMNVLA